MFFKTQIPYEIRERRAGDIGSVYADASLAGQELNWHAARGLDDMCKLLFANI